jgi:hypothetical protein
MGTVEAPNESQPAIEEPQSSVAQNIAASEASNELLGNQPPHKSNEMSDVLDNLFD